ncbi:RimK family alpha-L-glutamate ligase [Nocardioides sp.]|uniref:RimK family alpha-L-glutamate ligase n=1 Tax=Nocardioides sp. TaxID=35761 RepID=UPI003782F3C4
MEQRGEAEVPLVLLATCKEWADGEPGHAALDAALAAHGLASRWVLWDDLSVDWGMAEVVAVRSTWDYDSRLGEFLGWASGVGPALLNGVEVFRWNTDKRYLTDLQRVGLPVIPTVTAETVFDVRKAADGFGLSVVKPWVAAGGRGLEVVADGKVWLPQPGAHLGPWVVQPLVDTIHHYGETSVFVIAGRPVSQVQKLPSRTDIRVHEQFGGTSRSVELTEKAASLAAEAVATVVDLLHQEIVYARVDMMQFRGRLVVSEVELTEPGLYLDVLPLNALPFAEAIAARAYPHTW